MMGGRVEVTRSGWLPDELLAPSRGLPHTTGSAGGADCDLVGLRPGGDGQAGTGPAPGVSGGRAPCGRPEAVGPASTAPNGLRADRTRRAGTAWGGELWRD